MSTVLAIFIIGIFVTLVVAKGMIQANEFAKQELRKMNKLPPSDDDGEDS